MAEAVLAAEGLSKRFGSLVVTENVSLSIGAGELVALIGPNGAGKSSLVAQLSGRLTPDSGRIFLMRQDVTNESLAARARAGLVQSFQIPSLFTSFSILGNAAIAVQAQQSHAFRFIRAAAQKAELVEPARAVLEKVGLGERATEPVASLSHGERRYVELAVTLATGASVLLLDEPLAGLSHIESERMVAFIRSLKGRCAILLIEHDMDAVFALADRILVLVQGMLVATGRPNEIRNDPVVQQAYLGSDTELDTM
jgi:branched-chain amino acid transport system ATP-binding protein